jgi:hypothetical protein
MGCNGGLIPRIDYDDSPVEQNLSLEEQRRLLAEGRRPPIHERVPPNAFDRDERRPPIRSAARI